VRRDGGGGEHPAGGDHDDQTGDQLGPVDIAGGGQRCRADRAADESGYGDPDEKSGLATRSAAHGCANQSSTGWSWPSSRSTPWQRTAARLVGFVVWLWTTHPSLLICQSAAGLLTQTTPAGPATPEGVADVVMRSPGNGSRAPPPAASRWVSMRIRTSPATAAG
jgi:hypothetical protein